MTIVAADIKRRLSVKTGAAGDSTASAPADSLGKYMSTTAFVNGSLHNLFDAVSGVEAAAGDTEYRCIFVLNDHATDTWTTVIAWIESQTAFGADITIGLDPAGITAKGSAGAQAAEIATEADAPAGVTFSLPTTDLSALAVGNVGPGQCFAIWLKRVVPPSANALALDGAVLMVRGTG